jgi:hypothetical protein
VYVIVVVVVVEFTAVVTGVPSFPHEFGERFWHV